MKTDASPLAQPVLKKFGLRATWKDVDGKVHKPTADAVNTVAQAMADTAEDAVEKDFQGKILGAGCKLHETKDKSLAIIMPPVVVLKRKTADNDNLIAIPLKADTGVSSRQIIVKWFLHTEDGHLRSGIARGAEAADSEINIQLPNEIGLGYHRLEVCLTADLSAEPLMRAECPLIVAPDKCYMPDALEEKTRFWGPVVNLTGFNSNRNWGIGDFTDLKAVVAFCASQGGSIVGLSPLHGQDPTGSELFQRHLPSDRNFLNVLYIDVEATEDFQESEHTRRLVHSPEFQQRLEALRQEKNTNIKLVAQEKLKILDRLYQQFRSNHIGKHSIRAQAFRHYQQAGGIALKQFATHQALVESFAREGKHYESWRAWPEKYRDVNSEAVKQFAAANNERIEFFEYLQWQADLQLQSVGRVSMHSRLPVGLLIEVSTLVSPHGAEVWQHKKFFGDGVQLAEQPRQYLPEGHITQSPPFKMVELRRSGYKPLRDLLSHNMRHAGAIKIASIHNWLSPLVAANLDSIDSAVLIEEPLDELLSVIALESRRNSCAVVIDAELLLTEGEIGSAKPVHDLLKQWNIIARQDVLNHTAEAIESILDQEGPAKRLLEMAPAHLSPLSAFWLGSDLTARKESQPEEKKDEQNLLIDRRISHRVEILRLLEKRKLLPAGMKTDPSSAPALTPPLVSAILHAFSQAACEMILFRVEDLGTEDRPFQVMEDPTYPNWKVRMSPAFEQLVEQEVTQLTMEALQCERGCFFDQIGVSIEQDESGSKQVEIPSATYRLQMHKGFNLKDANALVDYLDKLGISHVYMSPLTQARPGSLHGYDVTDHSQLNPELGDQKDLDELAASLKAKKMGMIMDLVPNHMGIGRFNAWWVDVLEHGPASDYGQYFDIDWSPVKKELLGKVLLPILGDPYGKILTEGQLQVAFDPKSGRFDVNYYENKLPLNPVTYPLILGRRLDVLNERLGNKDRDVMSYCSIIDALSALPSGMGLSLEEKNRRLREISVSRERLQKLCADNPVILEFINQNIEEFDTKDHDQAAVKRLHELLEKQSYRLSFWRVAAHEINYRRFFDINDLAGVRVEDPRAFNDMHSFVLKLVRDGKVQGLRIDHPDGLFDPEGYFKRLQEESAARMAPDGEPLVSNSLRPKRQEELPIYLLGEKILAPFERMEEDWLIHGTTGYDFLNAANGLLVDERHARVFTEVYEMVSNRTASYREQSYECKHLIMQTALSSELNVLAHQLNQISESNWMYRDYTLNSLRHALSEVVAFFPVYRTYVKEGKVSSVARDYISRAVRLAKRNNRTVHPGIFDFIRDVLTLEFLEPDHAMEDGDEFKNAVLNFAMKFQQFTGPVMAKSLEDTLFYKYNRFVGLNEVGGEPNHFGLTVADFHSHNEGRQKSYPYSMLTTSTHDTKRSEDVRARLSVISEIPDNWQERVLRWMDYNSGLYGHKDDKRIPASNDEYLIYQTLVGTYPLHLESGEELTTYAKRIETYMLKAAREAKDNTSWINQDAPYEDGMSAFINSILQPSHLETGTDPFFIDFIEFHQHVSRMGLIKSLTQTLLKLTCPGVPDLYQGNELFDFSLVDPDNRRPVDFKQRNQYLDAMSDFIRPQSTKSEEAYASFLKDMLKKYKDGRLKLFLTAALLNLRKEHPKLFTTGKYIPLGISGEGKAYFISYLREHKGKVAIAVAPVLASKLISPDQRALYEGPDDTSAWQTTKLNFPRELQRLKYTNILTGQSFEFGERRPRIANILERFPVALLINE